MIEKPQISKRPWLPVLLFVGICGVGIVGYWSLEPGWSLLDAIFMTFITLTTVGYSDYGVSATGRIFTLVLLFAGIGSFTYAVATVTTYLVEGHLRDSFRRRRMEKLISGLSQHSIICGMGNTGRYVLEEFQKVGHEFVVIDADADRMQSLCASQPFPYVQGDATDDRVLEQAGIERAERLITTLREDKDNLFVVLSARRLNPALRIIAKVIDVGATREKMRMAGANEVISPDAIGGLRMASVALRPQVVGFLDLMLREETAFRFEEARIGSAGKIAGKSIGDARIRDEVGLLVVAVRKHRDGRFVYNPGADLVLEMDDVLFAIGDPESVGRLRKLAGSP